ncbi:MAG: PPC domain-containing DNA-binding protein [Candidatus Sumerlaeia bacterium]
MDYIECNMGRTFVARLYDGESVYDAVESLAAKENILSASVLALGGMRKAGVVTGPANPDDMTDLQPMVQRFDDAREMLGVGTIFQSEGKPLLHFHAGMGRGESAIIGCPREEAICFLIQEVVIIEWTGLDAERKLDADTGFRLLALAGCSKL